MDDDSDDEPPPPPPGGHPDDDLGGDVEKDYEYMYDDFMDAVEDNHADAVAMMLDSLPETSRKELVNYKDDDGFTPLLHACTKENGDPLVKLLIDYNANVNFVAPDGSTALDCAVQDNWVKSIDLLLKQPEINVNGGRCSALFMAAQEGYVETVKRLLRAKCRVDRRAYNGVTPLVMAIVQHYDDVVEVLLKAKASATAPSAAQGGRTPLLMAVERNDAKTMQHLVKAKADVNRSQRVMHGFVPMNKDAPKSGSTKQHARVHLPITRAAELGFTDMVELLSDLGADTSVKSAEGFTVPQLLVEHSQKQLRAMDAATSTAVIPDDEFKEQPPQLPSPAAGADAAQSAQPIFEGYMQKDIGLKKKNRYFVLCQNKLLFFKSKDDFVQCCRDTGANMFDLNSGKPDHGLVVGHISLYGASVENVEVADRRFQVFTCKNGAPKTYKLQCEDTSTTKEWATLIGQQCNRLRLEAQRQHMAKS